jgi:hypothetical protein
MDRKSWAVILFIAGACSWLFPGWNGFLFAASDVSAGQGETIGAILIVGALVLWFSAKKA